MLGGPKEFSPQQVEELYALRRNYGLKGRHPADLCPNTEEGKSSCHNCGGGCGNHASEVTPAQSELVADITKKVMAQLGLK